MNPRPLDYMPSALTAELRECVTFQSIVWDTGFGVIDILFVTVYLYIISACRFIRCIYPYSSCFTGEGAMGVWVKSIRIKPQQYKTVKAQAMDLLPDT